MTRVRSFDPRTRRSAASGPERRPATIRRARRNTSKSELIWSPRLSQLCPRTHSRSRACLRKTTARRRTPRPPRRRRRGKRAPSRVTNLITRKWPRRSTNKRLLGPAPRDRRRLLINTQSPRRRPRAHGTDAGPHGVARRRDGLAVGRNIIRRIFREGGPRRPLEGAPHTILEQR